MFHSNSSATYPHFPWGVPLPEVAYREVNRVQPLNASPLTAGFTSETRFYFVHSYYVTVDAPADSLLSTT